MERFLPLPLRQMLAQQDNTSALQRRDGNLSWEFEEMGFIPKLPLIPFYPLV